MEFRILGSLEIAGDGVPVPVPSLREQRLVAVLLLSPNRVVPLASLVDGVWDDDPPASAKRQVQNCLSALRRRLRAAGAPADVIVAHGPGYRAAVGADALDAARFHDVVERARHEPPGPAADSLRDALALWRGPALMGLGGRLIEAGAAHLDEQRLGAFERWFDLRLGLGRHEEAVAELAELAAAHPLRERLIGQLMLALHRSGRQAHALEAYERLRGRLADELGLDPSGPIRELHASILRGEASGPPPAAGSFSVTPRQLPAVTRWFVGRSEALAELDEQVAGTAAGAVIVAVTGPAGVGKTTVAVVWAHRVADRFPDGQLYVNLRGFDPGGEPTTAAEAVRGFLDVLGVPAASVPVSLDAQAALYRSLLAGKRMLVVLDNARDAGQLRPLLPGGAGCAVVVTSRNRLTSLVSTAGAHPVALGLLRVDEARHLLARRLGAARLAAEPAAADELIARCGRLPLAISVAVARVAANDRAAPLAAAVEQLRAAGRGLDGFGDEDPAGDVRAVFSWSYERLGPDAARLFRLLGLHPGPDLSVVAAASLAGAPVPDTRRLLAELGQANLVDGPKVGRYAMHDLLRVYARELVGADGPAVERLLDHYLHTARAADRELDPHRHAIEIPPGAAEEIHDHRQALDWFAAEHAVLLGAVGLAVRSGLDRHAWQLAWTLDSFLDRHGHWHDWARVQEAALAAALRRADRAGQAHAHRGLAIAHARLERFDDAQAHLRRALALFDAPGQRAHRARTYLSLAHLVERQGDYDGALRHTRRALELYRAVDDKAGQAIALNSAGWSVARAGDHRAALDHCREALALHEQVGDRWGQAAVWDSLGYINHHLGRAGDAVACYRRAVDLFTELGDRYQAAESLGRLGDTHHAAGDLPAAAGAWRPALDILRRLGHPDAARAENRLRQLDLKTSATVR